MKKKISKLITDMAYETELPFNEICGGLSASLSGNREIIFYNIKGIGCYSRECVILFSTPVNIKLTGKNFILDCYRDNAIMLRGEILVIEFGEKL